MATTMLPPAFGGIVGVPSTKGPKIVRELGPSVDTHSPNANNSLISGTTKDSTGTALGNCDVHLFTTLDDLEVQQSVSDASGSYAFYVHEKVSHYIVAYKSGSPDVAGTTIDTLRGTIASAIDDFYSEANDDGNSKLISGDAGFPQRLGQSFISNGGVIVQAKFYLQKFNSPTGTATANLYAVTGVNGLNALPTGSALATSGTIDVSTLSAGSPTLQTLNFTGANQVTLTAGSTYCIAIEYTGGDATNAVYVGGAGTVNPPTDDGNGALGGDGSWFLPVIDFCFYVIRAT